MNISDFDIIQELGKGARGTVFLGKNKDTGIYVAIKRLKKFKTDNDEFDRVMNALILKEIKILRKVPYHKNLVNYLGFSNDKNYVYIFIEYVTNSKQMDIQKLPQKLYKKIDIMYQLSDALDKLHKNNIIHGDIKPQNILIKNHIPYIIDYDLACITDGDEIKCSSTGTPSYLAPELIDTELPINKETDIWSLGITFYEIINGVHPYPFEDVYDIMDSVKNMDIENINSGNNKLDNIIRSMLKRNPEERAKLEDIVISLGLLLKIV